MFNEVVHSCRWRLLRLAASILTVGLLVACSEEPLRPATELSDASPPEFINGGECAPYPVAGSAGTGCVTVVRGDAGGDDASGTLFVYARMGADRRPRSWHLRLESSSATVTRRLDAGSEFSYPRAIGAADVDGDGRDEWFVKVLDLAGHGAAWQRLNLFAYRDGGLKTVDYEGSPLALNVGGISRLGEGIDCMNGNLVLLRAEAKNTRNTRWRYSARPFDIDESDFIERRTGRLTISDYNDPALDRFYGLNCGDLHYAP